MNRYDIILPTFGQRNLVETCIDSIWDSGDRDYRIIKINNSPDDWGYNMPYNVGFTNAINIGLSISQAPYVVFMNSDTEVKTPGWLEKLESSFTPQVAAVGPATNNPHQWQGKPQPAGRVYPELINHSFGFSVKLTFFCIMISREAFLDIGFLDPRLPHGLGADDDWLWRAHLRGWHLKFQPSVMVNHIGAASWDMEIRNKQQKEATAYLKEKHDASLLRLCSKDSHNLPSSRDRVGTW
jgi:GT2 family glycosyltransferase